MPAVFSGGRGGGDLGVGHPLGHERDDIDSRAVTRQGSCAGGAGPDVVLWRRLAQAPRACAAQAAREAFEARERVSQISPSCSD